jgi:hypothetical protein
VVHINSARCFTKVVLSFPVKNTLPAYVHAMPVDCLHSLLCTPYWAHNGGPMQTCCVTNHLQLFKGTVWQLQQILLEPQTFKGLLRSTHYLSSCLDVSLIFLHLYITLSRDQSKNSVACTLSATAFSVNALLGSITAGIRLVERISADLCAFINL